MPMLCEPTESERRKAVKTERLACLGLVAREIYMREDGIQESDITRVQRTLDRSVHSRRAHGRGQILRWLQHRLGLSHAAGTVPPRAPAPSGSPEPDFAAPDYTEHGSSELNTPEPDFCEPECSEPECPEPDCSEPDSAEPTPKRARIYGSDSERATPSEPASDRDSGRGPSPHDLDAGRATPSDCASPKRARSSDSEPKRARARGPRLSRLLTRVHVAESMASMALAHVDALQVRVHRAEAAAALVRALQAAAVASDARLAKALDAIAAVSARNLLVLEAVAGLGDEVDRVARLLGDAAA